MGLKVGRYCCDSPSLFCHLQCNCSSDFPSSLSHSLHPCLSSSSLPPPFAPFPFLHSHSSLLLFPFSLLIPSSPLSFLPPPSFLPPLSPPLPPSLPPSCSREWHTNVNSKPALTMKETSQQKKLVRVHCVIQISHVHDYYVLLIL